MSDTLDRNLLFGALALQLDLINREQLVAGINIWASDLDRTLADVLRQSGVLSAESCQVIEPLVEKHRGMHDGNVLVSLSTLPLAGRVQAAASGITNLDGAASFATQLPLSKTGDSVVMTPVATNDSPGIRFRILRPHAQGGLGKVSVAKDVELNREVAIKEIQPQFADDLDSRARFILEAEVTGSLEHPSIVPVYGLGCYADGRPYYAMRFIKGDSLKDVVDGYHAKGSLSSQQSSERLVELRRLLGRFVNVCQAMEYAHSRHVIHRDLKPANIMLGDYGETLVVDWGLAKRLGSNEIKASIDVEPSLSAVNDGTTSSSRSFEPTQIGSTVGTLQFMSPEQAAGSMDLMGPAADIYSLGATLYYLLTGQPSVSGNTLGDILQDVQSGNIQPPSKLAPGISKPLEAVCLKAMALQPQDRYASALELADDLERWLADEPVSVHREARSDRLARWLRRNRSWFRAVAMAVIVIILVLGVAVVLVNGQRQVAEQERERATGLAAEKSALAIRETELRRKAEWQSASRSFEQSLLRCERVDAASGVLSLVNDLEEAQRIEARDLEYSIRAQLGRWGGAVHSLQNVFTQSESIRTLTLSPSGSTMLVATNSQASLIDLATGLLIGSPCSHQEPVTSAAFCRLSEVLITASEDKTVRFWNSNTAEPFGEPLLHDEPVVAISLSPDEKYLATASGTTIRIWLVESRELTDMHFEQQGALTDVQFSRTEPVLYASDWNGRVLQWSLATHEQVGTPWEHGSGVLDLAISPDGKLAATGEVSRTAWVWDVATGKSVGMPLVHQGIVMHVSFSPNGQQLMTASADQMVRVWDVKTGEMVGAPMRHPHAVDTGVFDDTGEAVWTGCGDGGLRIWRLANNQSTPLELGKIGNVIAASFTPDDSTLRMLSSSVYAGDFGIPGELRCWSIPDGKLQGTPMLNGNWLDIAAFSHDGNRMATATKDNAVQIWLTASGEADGPPIKTIGATKTLAFSHNDAMLFIGGETGHVQLYGVSSGDVVGSLHQLAERVPVSVFFPDDDRILVGCWDQTARIFSVGASSNIDPIELKHDGLLTAVDVHPQGTTYITGASDGSLRLWDAQTNQQVGRVMHYDSRITNLYFTPDGNAIVASYLDGSTRLWDVRTFGEIGPPMWQSKDVTALAISRNGEWAATASVDATARLWRITPATGTLDQVKRRYETLTGIYLEADGSVSALSIEQWVQRQQALEGNKK